MDVGGYTKTHLWGSYVLISDFPIVHELRQLSRGCSLTPP